MNLNDIAFDYVEYTQRHVLISGKAGTGKTTLLKRIKYGTHKNTVVVAPTGVAAINAGGVTIHSFFQLPFNAYVPEKSYLTLNDAVLNRERLLSKHKLNKERLAVFKSMELLIIDEISMVRCDVMDMMNVVLQHARQEHHLPFGGVQVVMIGDLYQLSPVIKDEEWQHMKHYYNSSYFFDSGVYPSTNTINIELDKIYRQQDENFIAILNGVRNNELTDKQYEQLHQCLDEYYEPRKNDGAIILTTHNQTADEINVSRLTSIKKNEVVYSAEKEGLFDERNTTAETELRLKVGAQIMFVKNDMEKVRRFFNGKIAFVKELNDENIIVEDESGTEITVTRHVWENIKYEHNSKENRVDEQVIGRFKQFPLRLAWAITIHKSQGLTFEHVVIDAGRAFSPGQVYVALSRCTTLKGIILKSRIPKNHFKTDERIKDFYALSALTRVDEEHLLHEKIFYQFECVQSLFDLSAVEKPNNAWMFILMEHKNSINKEYHDTMFAYRERATSLYEVSLKFMDELKRLHRNDIAPDNNEQLKLRTAKAATYFTAQSLELLKLLQETKFVTDNKQAEAKLYSMEKELYEFWHKKNALWLALNNGFDSALYFNALKAHQTPRLIKAGKSEDAVGNTRSLKQLLLSLRDELCEEHQLPAYRVATVQTIEALCEQLPQNEQQLLDVKGFGQSRVRQFGTLFLQVIQDYCLINHIDVSTISSAPVEQKKKIKKEKVPTHEISAQLFREGKSIAEIATLRGFTVGTIESHLAYAVSNKLLNAEEIIGAEKLNIIVEKLKSHAQASVTEIKQLLPQRISFGEIRIGINHLKLMESMPAD